MINNPYREQYRDAVENRLGLNDADLRRSQSALMVDLYYALDEALGRIYELEQTLEGREYPADREDELVPVGDREWNE